MYKTIVLPHFKRQLKPLVKKYPTLKDSLIETLETFAPARHPHIGNDLYKIRLTSKELQKGKSKSFRLIVLVTQTNDILVPVTIYFKGDRENIPPAELNKHLEIILYELME